MTDDTWFRQCFLDHYDLLCRYAVRSGLARTEAEEVVQDVFVRLWHGPQPLRSAVSSAAYLHGAVRHAMLNQQRKVRTRRRLHEGARADQCSPGVSVDTGHPPDMLAERAALAEAVQTAIAELPSRGREALLLQRESGLTSAEIAEVMSVSESTVKTHIARALAALREKLAAWRETAPAP
ncbi:sigma-70 family RNA polymerase sigma factor [Gemmatimonas sp.]|uniref:RNA polymerase sigma factor n=1 Tax=Gemmatimonas sp. TaxID=1962908 RepID=UPI00333F35D2